MWCQSKVVPKPELSIEHFSCLFRRLVGGGTFGGRLGGGFALGLVGGLAGGDISGDVLDGSFIEFVVALDWD